ncbi:peptidase M17 [Denitratisoma sp. DHT3]|uniref:M17 family metallopeptidase n=1 Tax=Denitratisoma sp. DHT3 TaxID=1981880 RepID=UPI0011989440|nr:leucyl aminopeptidase family protein [Denitratisoma sp. DHT3]QDX82343.1 peptidase M17 [Denitratisoma sp. DHT3]
MPINLAQLRCHAGLPGASAPQHQLWLLPPLKDLPADLPAREQWRAVLARRETKVADLAKTPQAMDLPGGGRMVLAMADAAQSRFERLSLLRKALLPLLEEKPAALAIVARTPDPDLARDAVYVAWLNGVSLPARKKKAPRALGRIDYFGAGNAGSFAPVAALARANTLARELTALPPNELTPADYRRRIRQLAAAQGWQIEEYDFRRLKKLGAGAFCAVAQGSDHQDAAIVRLRHRPRNAKGRSVALVGKGICFDTGGHNLKPARYMQGMHEDMNGSAVVLGLFQAITELRLPIAVDAWLAIAHNHLSPGAYKQNDIVTALDGTSIEVVHTDAEGRMVLADALTLASRGDGRQRPDLIVDFATLTGSMHAALGSRYSGVFASDEALAALAVTAGRASGERVCAFPMDEDYEPALDSKVADIKQCTMEGEADHILAARFLKRFTGERPWLHVDLSASSCSGGLGATASDLTGFGVAWGLHLLNGWAA